MKVLFFANTDWYLYNFRLGLARFLRERGTEVVMMSPYGAYGPRIEAAGFRWFPLPMDRRSLNLISELTLLRQISEVFRTEKPDVIHNFTIKCVVYSSLVARWLGISRRINAVTGLGHVFISDSPQARLLRPLVKSLLRFALGGSGSRLILQNPDDVRLFTALGLVGAERIRLIRSSGVDTLHFTPFERERDGPFRVLLASRLLWEKGIREYIVAAERLGSRVRGVEFLLAGVSDPGNPAAVPEADIAQWDEAGVVKVLGHVEDMARLMHTVDLVVLPSYREGAPKGLIEAAAMGLPIITTDAPGCREVVDDGVNGFLVPVGDATALSDRIEYLLNTSDVCRRFGAAGRKKVLEEFDERIVFRKTYAVYQELRG
ncbi:glycosyltransferase family 4 protein [Candidatus Thiosymbion oneisti]|uniref:glycosyltransferase family 4 protein n=1 Tax=Candidatus Thiosymbion oneisti TaxID=589554 RepID=UPI000A6BB2B1|nr:glycosyltransferase family 4 protein [Candidatus Thiosymbion oneisti]